MAQLERVGRESLPDMVFGGMGMPPYLGTEA